MLHQPSPWLPAEKAKRSMWNDRRTQSMHAMCKESKLNNSSLAINSIKMYAVVTYIYFLQHTERGMCTELVEQILDVVWQPSVWELCSRFYSLVQSSFTKQKVVTQVFVKWLAVFLFLHFASSHFVPDTNSTLCVIIIPRILLSVLLLFPMIPQLHSSKSLCFTYMVCQHQNLIILCWKNRKFLHL